MTKEEKELLLKDLAGRLPYGTLISGYFKAGDGFERHFTMELNTAMLEELRAQCAGENTCVDNISCPCYYYSMLQPLLRPMSSITEDEITEFRKNTEYESRECYNVRADNEPQQIVLEADATETSKRIDWLNAHHFDYRGLIERGLALEAPEGMYAKKCKLCQDYQYCSQSEYVKVHCYKLQ